MTKKGDFNFRYYKDYSGARSVFKVRSSESFINTRKEDYEKDDLVEGDIIEHRLSGIDGYDPRVYGVIKSYNGKAYAVSFNDQYSKHKIMAYENLDKDDLVETKVIPIDELSEDYVTVTSNVVANGFSGPANPKFEPYDRCHNYLSMDAPMYEINEIYLIVMRLVAYQYELLKNGTKNLVVTADAIFLDQLDVHAFALLDHTLFDGSNYKFKRVSSYKEDEEGILLVRSDVAKVYEKHGYEVLSFNPVKKNDRGKQRERKK
ncbi:MAG: hypothetical protein K6G37_03670 [Bacilli bacterium]|nr:hypothetical protein [Bacilli bacterium]